MHARAWRRYRQSCECAIRSTLILGMPYLGGMACLSAVPRAYSRSFVSPVRDHPRYKKDQADA